jgi:hypothetical protein
MHHPLCPTRRTGHAMACVCDFIHMVTEHDRALVRSDIENAKRFEWFDTGMLSREDGPWVQFDHVLKLVDG